MAAIGVARIDSTNSTNRTDMVLSHMAASAARSADSTVVEASTVVGPAVEVEDAVNFVRKEPAQKEQSAAGTLRARG
jgi:hypothetical protein